jgi:hypothetical protein
MGPAEAFGLGDVAGVLDENGELRIGDRRGANAKGLYLDEAARPFPIGPNLRPIGSDFGASARNESGEFP